MDYFGRSLFALSVAALLTLGLTLALSVLHKRPRRQIASQALWLWLLYCVSAFVLCSSLFAYKLYGRETTPLELPPNPVASPASPDDEQ